MQVAFLKGCLMPRKKVAESQPEKNQEKKLENAERLAIVGQTLTW